MSELSKKNYHIGDVSQDSYLFEPARTNTFEFIMNPNLDTLLMAGVDKTDTQSITDDDYLYKCQEKIRLAVSSASVPQFSIEPIQIRRGNANFKFAGQPTFDSGSLKVMDYVGARTQDIMLAWQAKAYDVVNDVVNAAPEYKFDCWLVEYNVDMTKPVRTWTLIGCWVSKVNIPEFNHSENQKKEMDVTIEYDRAVPSKDLIIAA